MAGEDFVVIGGDTRLSVGNCIYSRNQSKLFQLSDTTVMGSTGCWCDILTLTRNIQTSMEMYQHANNKVMTTEATAQMLSNMLYCKRFFPYMTSNIVAGLDTEGNGCVYNYDPIGHFEKCNYSACGSAGAFTKPFLDNQIAFRNMLNVEKEDLTIDRSLNVIKDVFISAAERDIFTGDGIDIKIITSDGIKNETFKLRQD